MPFTQISIKVALNGLRANLFKKNLKNNLENDAIDLLTILLEIGEWNADADAQLNALENLLTNKHRQEKVLIFSQFADTVNYLAEQLQKRGVSQVEGVTGAHPDPTYAAWRFSPVSNEKRSSISEDNEIRVLIATDVLSEGQNLQDSFVVVNYDLPWAIIRLIQRAGRVDRIGQQSKDIYCYSMWPSEGIEQIINLRSRLHTRLQQNAEVVGTDEVFFEDEDERAALDNLYNERTGILDEDEDREIDLVSHAFQIWKNATDADPSLKRIIPKLPNVVLSNKAHLEHSNQPPGILVYLKTANGNDGLMWLDEQGESVTTSQFDILEAAACSRDEPALPRLESHHELVTQAVKQAMQEQQSTGIQLGRTTGARFKTYERMKNYWSQHPILHDTLEMQQLAKAIEQLGKNRLREGTKDRLNRQLRIGINNEQLARMVVSLYDDNNLCVVHEDANEEEEPQIICSLGLTGEQSNQ